MQQTASVRERGALLREKPTLENLFELTIAFGERPAARYLAGADEVTITYAEYAARARACASNLQSMLGRERAGRFVAIQMDTSPDWFTVFWGVIMAGYPAVLVDFNLSDDMTDYMLAQAGACAVVALKRRALRGEVTQIDCAALLRMPLREGFAPDFSDKVALCTSGTTDTSRVFVYHAAAVIEQVLNSELLYNQNKQLISDEPTRSLSFLPFHHVFGFMVCLLWMHYLGFENVYLKDRSPQTIVQTATRFRITHLVAVPLLANNLSVSLQKKISKKPALSRALFKSMRGFSLFLQTLAPKAGMDFARNVLFASVTDQMLGRDVHCVILGGSHTPQEHMRTLTALGYYTVSGFGMTETAITSVETSMQVRTRTSGSVGMPLTSAEYRVQSDGARSNRGEMFIRGKSLHTGRLVDGKLLPPDLDAQGWYRTGDVVRLEKGGRMYVEGRSKDVIINESGENVYPDEIEDSFSALEGVDQFCVLGVRNTGKSHVNLLKRKRRSAAYEDITLVLSVGDRYKDDEALRALLRAIAQINSRLPLIKRITRVLVTPEKFQTSAGIKVKRLALKKSIEENKLAYRDLDLNLGAQTRDRQAPVAHEETAPVDLALEEIKQKVRRVYAETLEISPDGIRDDAHFIEDLGGDSLQVLGLSLKVEEMFSVLIPVEEYGRCTTVSDLAALLYERIRGHSAYSVEGARDEEVVPIVKFEDSPEFQAFHARQQALIGAGDNPYFVAHDSPLRDTSVMAGETVLNFGSYNYVGMSGRMEVSEAAKAAIDKYGTSASGSRLLGGEKPLHQELEREIANWKHTESALVLVGGHSTNVTFVGNFCGKNDLIVYDAIAHNSVEQGCRLSQATAKPFPHSDVAALESILRTQRHKFAKVLIVIEGAYSMDGDIAPVPAFVRLKKQYGCFLMVDEAHSACVIGETGGGVDEYFGLAPGDVDIKMGTLSKGLGACGGYLAGPQNIIEYLRYSLPGFVFSVGISPPLAAATLASIRLLRSDPSIMARMRENIQAFMTEAHARNMNTCLAGETAIVPILVGKDEDAFLLSNMLRKKGVFVPPAVYPAVPKNRARLRFCVTSEHNPEQIARALALLAEAASEAGIALPA